MAGLPKKKLVEIIETLRNAYRSLLADNRRLKEKNEELEKKLKEHEVLKTEEKIKEVNKKSNRPSSKQAEREMKGVGNDGKGKKRGRGKKGRKGAGNRPKGKKATKKERAKVEKCANCGKDLGQAPPLKSTNKRIVEDIPGSPMETEVTEIEQEKKYCPDCQKVTTAKTGLALPKADIGLNTTVHLVYLWISMCLPFTRMAAYFTTIFSQTVITAGLSRHIIRVAGIMKTVYGEILEDVKKSNILHADETGWRVQGKNWWLWVFGTREEAVYTVDRSRGKDVVRRILGEFFMGALVVDGWRAYMSLLCEQQSCMAHLLRKIRKLYAAFPELVRVYGFFVKFRRILRDGERLQAGRAKLEGHVFKRRLDRLHARLDALLEWPDPGEILQQIIKKVKNQRPRILTFVEHPGVPCHNNYGEYLIRIGVLKRKVSFGSRSAEGAEAYAVLLSIYTTCKLREISFFGFMKQSLQHYTQTGTPLLLKEYIAKKDAVRKAEVIAA